MNPKNVLFLLGVTILLGTFAQNLFMPILPAMQEEFHTTAYIINWTISIFTVALAVMQIVYGPLIDLWGRKKVMVPALILYMLASFGCYMVESIYPLLFFRALQGIGFAAIPIVAATVIGDLFSGQKRAEAMGTYQMMLGIGPAIGPLLGGWIGGVGGHSAVFLFLAISAVFLLIANTTLLPETKKEQSAAGGFHFRMFGYVLKQPIGASVILLGFTQMFTYYSFLLYIPVQLTNHYQLSAEQIGLVFLLVSATFMISSKVSGKVQKRLGTRWALLVTAGANALATFLFMALADVSLILLVIASACFGFTLGIGMPVHTTLLSEAFEKERGTAIGVYNFIRYGGMAAGPVVGIALFGWGGTWLEFGVAGLTIAGAVLFAGRKVGLLAVGSR
ncbi:MFS transporter [Brevibacillus reuszeri]|uniref:Arabinose ABC transporter permease n=1 Tax=Brevibacillus reuszeri TaxID=54915 RepID=A0A0K9YNG0_9BACL|nr:MFS transporter [Brevibacillus reuszeri]KNB70254.1 arabinose ABC transporter permease [Brevibacillus reuszeri]MED1859212.1 MFS transporter [Brevibacillus reuszeri]GED72292.1 MFS transporter [Brevibacillus reuszeri]